MKKIFFGVVKGVVLTVFFLYLAVLVVQKVTNNNASLAGYRIFNVVSESMVPKYQIGDILIVKDTDAKSIKVGDDLCYLGREGDFTGKIVTHAVKEVNKNDDGKMSFITEGIANVMPDPEVSEDQIYGTVAYKTIILSLIGKLLHNKIIFFIVIILPIIGYIIFKLVKVINDVTKDSDDDDEDEEEEN